MKNDLVKTEWFVKSCSYWTAVDMVERYHYAGSGSKISVATHGLYNVLDRECYGVAWWLPPASKRAALTVSSDWRHVLSLSRFVIHPDAPFNSASFLLSRSIKLLPPHYHTLVTYADTWKGHIGTIYKATNWSYVGLTAKSPIWLKDGKLLSIRNGDKTFVAEEMRKMGAEFLGRFPKHKYVYYRRTVYPKQMVMF